MELLETMRLEAGAVALLDRHLDRLSRSAAFFGYALDAAAVRDAVEAAARGLPPEPHRLRLTLDRAGHASTAATPLADLPPIRTVARCRAPGGLSGPFGRHKTTERALYAPALASAAAAGADEALLVDRRGLLVEATRASVWVRRDGRLLTPPLDRAGLPGVMRAHLLATRTDAVVAPIEAASLGEGDALFLSNAVRGCWRVSLRTGIEGPA
jgi:para-aminobenzoate synthetase/4-amino-4-deoxychorismate lyase